MLMTAFRILHGIRRMQSTHISGSRGNFFSIVHLVFLLSPVVFADAITPFSCDFATSSFGIDFFSSSVFYSDSAIVPVAITLILGYTQQQHA